MMCIDCNYCTTEEKKGVVFFKCIKSKLRIDRPFGNCSNKKANLKNKFIDKYMKLYRNKTTREIAKIFGWSYQKLYAFIHNNLLPFEHTRKNF